MNTFSAPIPPYSLVRNYTNSNVCEWNLGMKRSLGRTICQRFVGDDFGGISVESALWAPIYAVFFALIADVSLALNGKSQAQRVIQDVNRLASYGYIVEEDGVETRAESAMAHISANAQVDTTIDDTNNIITTVATFPAEDVMPLGLLTAFTNLEITVVAFHVLES